DPAGGWREAAFTATDLVVADPERLVGDLLERLDPGDAAEGWLDRFERAMALRKHCAVLLSDAETRIEQLVNEGGDTEPFSARPNAGDTDADQA
ncbi:MAG: exodeoxyribonuclease VII small subunit, partial [Armatimonadota bacterium]